MNQIIDRQYAMTLFGIFSRALLESDGRDHWRAILPQLTRMNYFSAPCSTKFHLCVPGGLLIHSVMVTKLALEIAEQKFPMLDGWHITVAGLLHDVGKCGLYDGVNDSYPRYIKNPEPFPTWPKQQKWWAPYLFMTSKPHFNNRDLSPLYCARWGLPWNICHAIMVHDGMYEPGNVEYFKDDMPPLSLVLHLADLCHAKALETKENALDKREE